MKSEIITAASEIAREKRISKDDLRDILEEIFTKLMVKKFGEEADFDVIVNVDRGDVELLIEKEVVREVTNPKTQISLEEARKHDPEVEEGEIIAIAFPPEDFGRRLINSAKQTLLQKIREFERHKIYDEYSHRVGEIIIGDVHQETRNGYFIIVDRTEMFMPRSESIPGERLRRGESIRALIKEVIKPESLEEDEEEMDAPRRRRGGNRPEIIVSRADKQFLVRLFEIEVPEIFDGIVEIKAVARKPGERSKIAVESIDKRIDPVGACVGMRGVRIQSVVKELNGEKIDVIAYSREPEIYVARALTPAKPLRVLINREENMAVAIIPDKDMGLAMGKGEVNRELAQELTGYKIELIKESEYYEKVVGEETQMDVSEIPGLSPKIVEKLKNAGINTAEELKGLGLQGLLEIPGIGQKTAQKILSQLNI